MEVDNVTDKDAFRTTMMKFWKVSTEIVFHEVGMNLYLFEIDSRMDLQKVLTGQPWLSNISLLCVERTFSSYKLPSAM